MNMILHPMFVAKAEIPVNILNFQFLLNPILIEQNFVFPKSNL